MPNLAKIEGAAPSEDGIGPRPIPSEALRVPGNISDPELGDGVKDIASSHSVNEDV